MAIDNVDREEIHKFSESAVHWWDPNGEFKALHDINPLRLGYIEKNVPLANKRVIDIGCGGGILSESMAKLGANVTGIDMSEAALQVAKLHLLESDTKVTYQCTTAEAMSSHSPAQFDVVTCLEMLEHVPDPQSVVRACASLVKPNGDIFFSTLNRNMKSYLFAIVGAEYILKLIPQNTHDFAKFIRPAELADMARSTDLSVMDIIGMTYNPFTKTYKLSSDVSVNYLMHLKKL